MNILGLLIDNRNYKKLNLFLFKIFSLFFISSFLDKIYIILYKNIKSVGYLYIIYLCCGYLSTQNYINILEYKLIYKNLQNAKRYERS